MFKLEATDCFSLSSDRKFLLAAGPQRCTVINTSNTLLQIFLLSILVLFDAFRQLGFFHRRPFGTKLI